MNITDLKVRNKELIQGFLLIAVGLTGIVLSTFADSLGLGRPGFGLKQFLAVVISAIVAGIGMVKLTFPDKRKFARLLAGIYVTAIFCAGLWPNPFKADQTKVFLDFESLWLNDFIINAIAFIPLGYLLIRSLEIPKPKRADFPLKKAIVAAGLAVVISFSLEFSQYYFAVGRHSSFADLTANTFGALIGINIYFARRIYKYMVN